MRNLEAMIPKGIRRQLGPVETAVRVRAARLILDDGGTMAEARKVLRSIPLKAFLARADAIGGSESGMEDLAHSNPADSLYFSLPEETQQAIIHEMALKSSQSGAKKRRIRRK